MNKSNEEFLETPSKSKVSPFRQDNYPSMTVMDASHLIAVVKQKQINEQVLNERYASIRCALADIERCLAVSKILNPENQFITIHISKFESLPIFIQVGAGEHAQYYAAVPRPE